MGSYNIPAPPPGGTLVERDGFLVTITADQKTISRVSSDGKPLWSVRAPVDCLPPDPPIPGPGGNQVLVYLLAGGSQNFFTLHPESGELLMNPRLLTGFIWKEVIPVPQRRIAVASLPNSEGGPGPRTVAFPSYPRLSEPHDPARGWTREQCQETLAVCDQPYTGPGWDGDC